MSEVIVMERPDFISWEDIRQTLADAHKNNIKHGLVVRSTTLSGDQLRKQVADGKCFVALDGNKLVGVAAVRIKTYNKWFCQGKVAHFLLDSVLPDYQGAGIYSQLQKKRYEYIEEEGISIITTNTAANNERMVKMLPKHGFHRAIMFHASDTDHFSITWVKWLKDEPSCITIWVHYLLSVIKVKLYYALRRVSSK